MVPEKRRGPDQAGRRLPFQGGWQHRPMGRTWLVNALEETGAECAPINDWLAEPQPAWRTAVYCTAPFAGAPAVKPVRVLEFQQRLRFAVTGLLFQIGAWRGP